MTKFQIVLSDGSTDDWDGGARYTVTDGGVLIVRSGETKVTYGPGFGSASWRPQTPSPRPTGFERNSEKATAAGKTPESRRTERWFSRPPH